MNARQPHKKAEEIGKKAEETLAALKAHDKKVRGYVETAFANGTDIQGGIVYFRYTGKYRWQVDFYHAVNGHLEDRGFPVGLAWVGATPPMWKGDDPPYLSYIIVADDERRQGIASRMIVAIKRRWPNLWPTGGISRGGRALVRKFWP
jgi:hypothetical protein